jgi:hypothetical protein
MTVIARSSLVRGPATVTFNGVTWYSQGDVSIKITKQAFDITVGGGKIDERLAGYEAEVSFTPSGRLLGLSLFSAFGALALGTQLYTSADLPVVVASAAATWTFKAGRISKIPSIIASARKTAFGSMTLKCIVGDGLVPGAVDSFLTMSAGAAPTGEASADIITGPWTITGGGLGTSWETADGLTLDFELQTSEQRTDSGGLVAEFLTGVTAKATFTPSGLAPSAIVTALQLTDAIGGSLNTGGVDLVATGSGITATLKGVTVTEAGFAHSVDKQTSGAVTAIATRASNTTLQALFTLA